MEKQELFVHARHDQKSLESQECCSSAAKVLPLELRQLDAVQ